MKETGIVRKVDRMGRVVLPKELRWKYKLECGDLIEVFEDDEGVYLKKYRTKSNFVSQVGELYRTVENIEKELRDARGMSDDPAK